MGRSKQWKHHEREVAKYFGVERRSRGADFSQEDVEVFVNVNHWLDVENSDRFIVVECKYRKECAMVPHFKKIAKRTEKIPVVKVGSYLLLYLTDFKDFFEDMVWNSTSHLLTVEQIMDKYELFYDDKKEPKYLRDYREQAADYSKRLSGRGIVLPTSCLAKSNTPGRVVAVEASDMTTFREATA